MKYLRDYTIYLLAITLLFCSVVKQTSAQIAITADVTLQGSAGTISKDIWGVDMQSLIFLPPPMGTSFFSTYIQQTPLRDLGAKTYRFPGGCGADSYDSTTGMLSYTDTIGPVNRQYFTIDEALTIANTSTGELLYQVNINGTDIASSATQNACGEISQLGKDTNTGLIPALQTILNNPAYASIKYFELGNSQYFNWTPTEYDTQARLFAQTIKAIKPTVKVGIVGYPSLTVATDPKKIAWNTMLTQLRNLSTCGPANNLPCFDFVTDHQTPQARHTGGFSGQAAYYPATNLQDPTQLPAFIANYPGKQYAITEWNLPCNTVPSGNAQIPSANNVDHGIFTFTSLLIMAENKVSMANYHDLSSNSAMGIQYGCGLFSNSNTLTAAGQAFQLTSVAAGAEFYNTQYVFPPNVGFLTIPANPGCTDPDCILQGGQNFSILSTFAAKQGDDLYMFLVNRSDAAQTATATRINANITVPIWPNYPPRLVTVDTLVSAAYNVQTFATSTTSLTDQTGKFVVLLLPTSVNRVKITSYFLGAPAATVTPLPRPSNNLTIIQKLINSKRTTINKCSRDLFMYIFAVVIYIMVIHFAIAMKEDFKMNLHISCFVIGGIVGYYLCHLEIGFIIGVVLSLFLW